MSSTLQAWLADLESAPLKSTGSREGLSLANLQIFTISKEELQKLRADQFIAFVEDAIRIFARKLRDSRDSLLFYMWFDEMSGTLRMSATVGSSALDLPFTCSLRVCQDLDELVADFLASETVDGIPMSALEEIEPGDDSDDDAEFVQLIFSRFLPRLTD